MLVRKIFLCLCLCLTTFSKVVEARPSIVKSFSKLFKTPGPLVPWAKQQPVESRYLTREHFVRGQGVHLWSNDDKQYLDMTAGYGAINLGRRYSAVEDAVNEQRKSGILHLQSDVDHPLRQELNSKLLNFTPIDNRGRCFFTLGGNNAVEAAYAMVRRAVLQQDPSRGPYIIAAKQGYSGASSTLPARITGEADRRSAFTSLCSDNIVHVQHPEKNEYSGNPYIEKMLELGPEKFTAIHLEGGGFTATSGGYQLTERILKELFEFAETHQIPIVDDETYSGFGRTGDKFGISHFNQIPSIMLGSKSITNGEGTLGYVVLSPELADIYDEEPMDFGLTFYAPLGDVSAAIAVIDTFEKNGDLLYHNCNERGQQLKEGLESGVQSDKTLIHVRQKGLMVIAELREENGKLWSPQKFLLLKKELANNHQILTMGRNGKLMLTPAVNISKGDIDVAIDAITRSIQKIEQL